MIIYTNINYTVEVKRMKNNQFVKVATITPKLSLGKPMDNIKNMITEIEALQDQNPHFIVFPELTTTGYSVGDLILHSYLIERSNEAIHHFLAHNQSDQIIIFGAPAVYNGALFNCAFVVLKNKVLGIIPKTYLPNYDEFQERRFFVSSMHLNDEVVQNDEFDAPMGLMVFKEESKSIYFGVEVCEDLWAPIPPNSLLSINGAEIVFNLSASNEILDKNKARRYITQSVTKRNSNAYVYVSSGRHESTQDTVYSNHSIITQDGTILAECDDLTIDRTILVQDLDLGYIRFRRRKNSSLRDSLNWYYKKLHVVRFDNHYDDGKIKLNYTLSKTPFVPKENQEQSFRKIMDIQKTALAKRFEHTGVKKLVIGLSGGLDSTLALLVSYETLKMLGRSPKDVIAITMPGFGTTKRTKSNAEVLGESLGVTFDTIDIKDSVLAHFKAIKHDEEQVDVTYENAQARERTNILMNLANKVHGIVVGTGDLSELALGWCTFNGDHMSNYSVNGGLPKTLVKFMVQSYADYMTDHQTIKETLYDILDTPISPELAGKDQKTEEIIGKYEVNDFIIYRLLMCGDPEERIEYLMKQVFKDELSDEEISHYLDTFYKRFFSQQFKRSTLPDGPKVVKVSLSPRSDFRMPSDISY